MQGLDGSVTPHVAERAEDLDHIIRTAPCEFDVCEYVNDFLLICIFTNDAGVLEELGPFMLTLALTQPLLGLHFTLSGALRGAGDTVSPLLAAAIGNWAFRVPLAWAFSHAGMPVIWMWVALVFDHVARVAIVSVVFARGRWHGTRSGRTRRDA